MTRRGWKAYEQRIAEDFGTERNPLSGPGSKHSGSDTLHAKLFIDAKVRREFRTAWRFFKAIEGLAEKEGKRPVLVVKVPGGRDADSIVACRLKDLKAVADEVKGDHADG